MVIAAVRAGQAKGKTVMRFLSSEAEENQGGDQRNHGPDGLDPQQPRVDTRGRRLRPRRGCLHGSILGRSKESEIRRARERGHTQEPPADDDHWSCFQLIVTSSQAMRPAPTTDAMIHVRWLRASSRATPRRCQSAQRASECSAIVSAEAGCVAELIRVFGVVRLVMRLSVFKFARRRTAPNVWVVPACVLWWSPVPGR